MGLPKTAGSILPPVKTSVPMVPTYLSTVLLHEWYCSIVFNCHEHVTAMRGRLDKQHNTHNLTTHNTTIHNTIQRNDNCDIYI